MAEFINTNQSAQAPVPGELLPEIDGQLPIMTPLAVAPLAIPPTGTMQPTQYKFGLNTLDINYYKHNLGTNILSYLATKNWNDALKQAFLQAYYNYIAGLDEMANGNSSRMYTDDFGTIYDANGIINQSGTDTWLAPDGLLYTNQEDIKGRLARNNAQSFNAYRELANYANLIGKSIIAKGPKTEQATSKTPAFDFNNHGFIRYWGDKIDPTGSGTIDETPFLNLDVLDPTTKTRGISNRLNYVAGELREYLNQLGDYDFSNSPYKTGDAYKQKVLAAINGLQDGQLSDLDKISLLAIGIGPDWYNTFFTTGESTQATPELTAAELEAQQEKENLIAYAKQSELKFYNSGILNETCALNLSSTSIKPFDEEHCRNLLHSLFNYSFPDLKNPDLRDSKVIQNYLNFVGKTLDAIKNKQSRVSVNGISQPLNVAVPLMLELLQGDTKNGFKQSASSPLGANIWYLDRPEDTNTDSVLVWDQTTNRLYYTWAKNVPESKAYQYIFGNAYKQTKVTEDDRYTFKEGGVLKFDNGGGLFEDFDSDYGDNTVAHAEKMGITAERARLRDRQIGIVRDNELTALNPEDATWLLEDYARLVGIGADITSLFLDPLSGAVAGLASTGLNTAADISDKSVSGWQAAKNTVMSLGLDALALIPGMESAKIIRELKPWSKKLITYASAAAAGAGGISTLNNADEIIQSLKKLNDPKQSLTVGDWQNIAQLITGITGTWNVGKSHAAMGSAKKKATLPDLLGVGLVDKDGNKVKDIILEGSKAKEMRSYLESGDLDKANSLIHNLGIVKDANGVDIDYKNLNVGFQEDFDGLQFPYGKTGVEDGKTKRGFRSPILTKSAFDTFNILDPLALKNRPKYITISKPMFGKDVSLVKPNPRLGAEHIRYGLGEVEGFNELSLKNQIALELNIPPDKLDAYLSNKEGRQRITAAATKKKDLTTQVKTSKEAALTTATEAKNKAVADLNVARLKLAHINSPEGMAAKQKLVNDRALAVSDLETLKADPTKYSSADNTFVDLTAQALAEELNSKITACDEGLKAFDEATVNTEITNFETQLANAESTEASILSEIQELTNTINSAEATLLKYTNPSAYQPSAKLRRVLQKLNGKTYNVTDADGNIIQSDVPMIWDAILQKFPELKKEGGAININKARQFYQDGGILYAQKGNPVRHTILGSGYSWNDNMGNTEEFRNHIASYNLDNYEDFNRMQDMWLSNYNASNFSHDLKGLALYQQSVYDRQGTYNAYPALLNNAIERAIDPGKHITRRGNSGDNAASGYQDGYFSLMENLRHFGADLGNAGGGAVSPELIALYNDITRGNGLEYYKSENGMYKLRPIGSGNDLEGGENPNNGENPQNSTPSNTPGELLNDSPSFASPANPAVKPKKSNITIEGLMNKLPNMSGNFSEFLRTAWLNHKNDLIVNSYRETPLTVGTLEHLRAKSGNLGENLAGKSAFAEGLRIAKTNATSDAALGKGAWMDAYSKFNVFRDTGRKTDDTAIKESNELVFAQNKENSTNRYKDAMTNREEFHGVDINNETEIVKNKFQKAKNYNQLWQKYSYDLLLDEALAKVTDRVALKKYDSETIPLYVVQNPEEFGVSVSDAYNKVASGIVDPSDLTAEEQRQYILDRKKVLSVAKDVLALSQGLQIYKGKGTSTPTRQSWSASVTSPDNFNGVAWAKKGTSVTKAKILEKIKNADRFLKLIEMQNKYDDKKEDRIAKSKYTGPKRKHV